VPPRGIVQNLYYPWSKEFLEAGKKRLVGDPARVATSDEVKELRREASALKEVVAELMLENRPLKKARFGLGRMAHEPSGCLRAPDRCARASPNLSSALSRKH
jgi:transposase-like protein